MERPIYDKTKTFALALILLLSMTGCTAAEDIRHDKPNEVSETEAEQTAAPEVSPSETAADIETAAETETVSEAKAGLSSFEGTYTAEVTENDEQYFIQIYTQGDIVLLEHVRISDGAPADVWGEEFHTDSEPQYDGENISAAGMSQPFYIYDGSSANYSSIAHDCTITMTPDGLILQNGNSEEKAFALSDGGTGLHATLDDNISYLDTSAETDKNMQPVGEWAFCGEISSAYMRFGEDGSFRFVYQQESKPVKFTQGAWTYDKNSGDLLCVSEHIGSAERYSFALNWYIDDEGWLHVRDTSSEGLAPFIDEVQFYPAESPWETGFSTNSIIGKYDESICAEGIFMDSEENQTNYSYIVPQLWYDTEAAADINYDIEARFGAAARNDLKLISAGLPPVYNYIGYTYTEFDGIEMLVPFAYSESREDCFVYCYDAESGRRIYTPELLERMLIPEENFVNAVREAAELALEQDYLNTPEKERDEAAYISKRDELLSDDTISANMPAFCTETGDLYVILFTDENNYLILSDLNIGAVG